MARKTHEEPAVKRYLLKQLSDAERQEIELRLLTDDDFAAELEIAENELIDEYVANELSPSDRKSFEDDFLINPDRESKLQASEALKRYLDRASPRPQPAPGGLKQLWESLKQLFTSSPIPAIVTVLVIAVFGIITWPLIFSQSDLQKGLASLNKAYSQERPIEARISSLGYARYEVTRSNQPPRVDATELDRAHRFLLDAEQAKHDAASLHGLGQYFLLQKDPNRAIEYLERARQANGSDPQIYADLGAAYFERGKLELNTTKSDNAAPGTGSGLEDLGRSVNYLKQALELDRNLLPALFNLGLVHEYQGLDGEAEADWRMYLQKDSNSDWSREATQKLKALEEKKNRSSQDTPPPLEAFMSAYSQSDETAAWEVFHRNHGQYGNTVTQALVNRFLSSDDGKNEALHALLYLGQLELRNTQDHYTTDLANFYASSSSETQTRLAEARRQLTEGQKLLPQSRIDEATESLTKARSTFEAAGDFPEVLATDYAIAHGAVVQPDLNKTKALLEHIVPDCETKQYKWMLAQALSERAHLQTNLNNFSQAIADGLEALRIFQELKDVTSVVDSLSQLAGLYLFLNDNEMSFSFLRQAIAIADETPVDNVRRWRLHVSISLNFYALKLYRAALDYQNEALQLALTSLKNSPLYVSRSYQYIGLTYGSLQRFDLALENLQKAYEQGQPLASERNGRNMMASASLKLGDLYRVAGQPAKSLSAYDESSRLYESIGFDHYSYAAHKGKFLAYIAQQDDQMAQQELQVVLSLFEKYREKIVNERQTAFFFDREQDTYDLAIDFTYARIGDTHRAFDYSETCRSRNLHDLMSHGAEVTTSGDLRAATSSVDAPALTVAQVQQQLPERVQLVQYALLDRKLLLWLVTRSNVVSKSVDIDSAKLNDTVTTALNQIKVRDDNGAHESLKQLHSVLIEPIETQLDVNKVICFVPDKFLHRLPFDALISGSSGRYLAQDYRVMTSPSATILIESTNKAAERAAIKEDRLLAVGDPIIDRRVNPDLPSLPDAQREVEKIALDYPLRRVLVQRQATRKSVMYELPRAQIAQFATHYLIDSRSKLSSKLVLSPDTAGQPASEVNSGDIYQMNLGRTKLVVLAACQTGVEQQFGGEGPMGFARSFLVAGVPVVVASLWPVDSKATADLMIAFHGFRKRGKSTTEALKLAQQEIMDTQDYRSPYYWAGFTTIGGYSEF